MKKLILSVIIISGLLLCTVRINAQSDQVSPVSNLQGSNSSVVNNNFQMVQNGINAVFGLFGQYFSNGILNVFAGGTGQDSSDWPTGDLVYISSPGIWGHAPSSSFSSGAQIFLTSGTFTAKSTGVLLTMLGAGGNGGNNALGGIDGGGGGGGGGSYVKNYFFPTIIGNTYTVTVGQNGGAASSFDIISIPGGGNGFNGSNNGAGSGVGGTNGGSTAGNTTTSGVPDYVATGLGVSAPNANGGHGGSGGSTLYGTGGTQGSSSAGGNGTGFGAGGGGGGGTSIEAGGIGSPGFVIVQY